MKILITLTICVIGFWACVTGNNTPNSNASDPPVAESEISQNSEISGSEPAPTPTPTPPLKSNYKVKAGDIKIDTYRDGQLESVGFYRNGKCVRYLTYNTQTKEIDSEIEYYYKKNGENDHQRVVSSRTLDLTEDTVKDFEEKEEKDFLYQRDYLKSKGIEFPLADLAADDISDIAETLGAGDDYNDFKKETILQNGKKIIKFTGFNKTGRYHNSPLEAVTYASKESKVDFFHIINYELVLKNRKPLKEKYTLDYGTVMKTFWYKNGNLTDITYEFIGLKNETAKETVHFDYKVLK